MEAIPPPDSPEAKSEDQRGWYKPWHGFVAWLVLFTFGQIWGWARWEHQKAEMHRHGEDLRDIRARLQEHDSRLEQERRERR